MKSLMKIFLSLVLLTTSVQARITDGNEGPNGGDDISLEFLSLAKEALDDIETEKPELLKQFSIKAARQQLKTLKVVATDKNQYLDIDSHQQSVVAVNYPDASLVIVHIAKWNVIKKRLVKKALVLHEVLSLIGSEDSGRYPISSAYLGETPNTSGQFCKFEKVESFRAEAVGQLALEHMPFPDMGGHRILIMPLAEGTKTALQAFAKKIRMPNSKDIKGLDLLVWPACQSQNDPSYRFGYFCYQYGVTVNFVYKNGNSKPGPRASSVILKHLSDGHERFYLAGLEGHPGVGLTYEFEELTCEY